MGTNGRRRGRPTDQTATLADVAKLAGVSSSTVSRVVNNSIPVSAELRATIERAIAGVGRPLPVAGLAGFSRGDRA